MMNLPSHRFMSTHHTIKLNRAHNHVDVSVWHQNDKPPTGVFYLTTGAATIIADLTPQQCRDLADALLTVAQSIEATHHAAA